MSAAKVTVTLQQPVHAGTGPLPDYRNPTHDHIPGSVLRGGCAAAWICLLGAPEPGQAHRPAFIDAFESDGVFGPLHRAGGLPVPLSVFVHKYRSEPGCRRLWWDRSLGEEATDCPECGQGLRAAKDESPQRFRSLQRTRAALTTNGVAEDEKLYRKDSLPRHEVLTGWVSAGAVGAFEIGGKPLQRLWLGVGARRVVSRMSPSIVTPSPNRWSSTARRWCFGWPVRRSSWTTPASPLKGRVRGSSAARWGWTRPRLSIAGPAGARRPAGMRRPGSPNQLSGS
ncbi:MAG TPA: hypothetical protein VIY28_03365 [Pseudonocardiaceae bacterium]